MKIAHVVGKLKAGGVESVVFSYLEGMDRDGLDIDVLYDDDSTVEPPDALIDAGIGFIKIPPYESALKYAKTVKKLCRERGYDIVHSHLNSLSYFPLRAAKRAHVPVRIAHNHTTSSPEDGFRDTVKRALRPFTKRAATDFAACSEKSARWMFGDRAVEMGEVTIFNNAVDVERFRFDKTARADIRRELDLGDSFVLLHVGRFVKTKNHAFILEVFRELLSVSPDSYLVFVGDGELADETKNKAEELGVLPRVRFCGIVPDAERYYSAADAFILPSFYEGLPVVAVEAQASGLDLYLSDNVTSECAVTDRVSFLSLSQSAEEWARAIAKSGAHDRLKDNEVMKNSHFNIKISAGDMRDYYLRIGGRIKR